jgi:magnesium transporter
VIVVQEQVKHLGAAFGIGHRRLRRGKPGSAPGTLLFHEDAAPTRMRVMAFGPDELEETDVGSLAEVREIAKRLPNVWLDVVGLGTEDTIRSLGAEFGLHGLLLEDLLNTHQRAKVETYPEGLFCTVRMPELGRPGTEQVSILLTDGIVITVQERAGDVFEAVRDRIRVARGQMRHRGCDYLMYAIVDAVIDSYFPVLEALGERLHAIEEEVMGDPAEDTITRLHTVRRELVGLRRAAWPHRDMLNSLIRDSGGVIAESTGVYLRDAYDHAVQIMDLTDSMRDLASDLLGLYMSVVSNRMNEVMKVLTIIATLFIPLSFVAGVYGMNFDPEASPWNMPELGWAYGYPVVLGFMLVFAFGLLIFFRRKGWF